MGLNAVWWRQEYTIPNRRQLNYAVRLAGWVGGYVLYEFQSKWARDEAKQMDCGENLSGRRMGERGVSASRNDCES